MVPSKIPSLIENSAGERKIVGRRINLIRPGSLGGFLRENRHGFLLCPARARARAEGHIPILSPSPHRRRGESWSDFLTSARLPIVNVHSDPVR